jgi:hypothetical protein
MPLSPSDYTTFQFSETPNSELDLKNQKPHKKLNKSRYENHRKKQKRNVYRNRTLFEKGALRGRFPPDIASKNFCPVMVSG